MNNLPNAVVTVQKWDNLEARYVSIMMISPSGTEIGKLSVATLARAKEFNLKGLEGHGITANIPPLLRDTMPGVFAEKMASTRFKNWYRSNDFGKIVALGNRDVGAYRIIVHERQPMDQSLIRDREHLNKTIDDLYIAVNKDELYTLLNRENFYSLTSTKGESPKIEYQDEVGERWVVRTGHLESGIINPANTKMEYALLNMLEDVGVQVPETAYHVTPEEVEVYMTKRYDLAQPVIDQQTGIAEHANKFATVTLRTLQQVANDQGHGVYIESYADAAKFLRQHSNTPDKDIKELLRRGLFDIAVNNTSTHSRNVELLENTEGYVLAPTVGVIPDVCRNRLNMPLTTKYLTQASVTFDSAFYGHVAEQFGLTSGQVKHEVINMAAIILGREKYFDFAEMSREERARFDGCFIANEKLMSVLEDAERNSALNSLRRSMTQGQSKSQSMEP